MAIGSTGNERRFHTSLKIQAASLYIRLGEFGPARQYLQEASAVARFHDYPDRINRIMTELGELNRAQERWAEARHFHGLSIAVSKLIAVPDLLDRMRDYAYDVLSLAGLEATFDFPTGLPDHRLSVLLRRNFYLIYKESLHNVLKHATGATAGAVSLRYVAGSLPQLVLEVRDNGPNTTATQAGPGHHSGHGLRNMATRAEALRGAATAGLVPSGGFRVQVAVSLASPRRAFGLKKMPENASPPTQR